MCAFCVCVCVCVCVCIRALVCVCACPCPCISVYVVWCLGVCVCPCCECMCIQLCCMCYIEWVCKSVCMCMCLCVCVSSCRAILTLPRPLAYQYSCARNAQKTLSQARLQQTSYFQTVLHKAVNHMWRMNVPGPSEPLPDPLPVTLSPLLKLRRHMCLATLSRQWIVTGTQSQMPSPRRRVHNKAPARQQASIAMVA